MIAERLRARRKAKTWSRRELSDRTGVHVATIADIEEGRNKRPSYDKVVLLAHALGMEPGDLFPVPLPEQGIQGPEQEAEAQP